MRAIIVDDEIPARAWLRSLLEKEQVEVVAEATNADEALALTKEHAPDLMLLDIRMPGTWGLEVADQVCKFDSPPQIIFVTGYSDHAVEAFEQSAVDYVLKPVSPERLSRAVKKARTVVSLHNKLKRAANLMAGGRPMFSRIAVRSKGVTTVVPTERVMAAVAQGKSVLIRTKDGDHRTGYTLTELERLLPGAMFCRIHASVIVNLAMVIQIETLGNHTYCVRLTNGDEYPLARRQYSVLQGRLGLAAEE